MPRRALLLFLAAGLSACEGAQDLETAPPPSAPIAPEVTAEGALQICTQVACAPKIGERAANALPGAALTLISFPVQKVSNEAGLGAVLNDIEAHLPANYGRQYRDADRVTHGHETSHGIHAHLRNHHNNTGQRANAFYLLEDKAALVVEPPIRKAQVAPFIPARLRGSRYATYVTGQAAWDDRPLYLWDEWCAYVNGSAVAIDLFRAGQWSFGSRDAVAGTLEFTVYALAVGMAVERLAPAYFEQNLQFREFLAAHTLRAMTLYRAGATMAPFARADQEALARALEESPEAEPIRAFAFRTFGEAWARHALFGAALPEPGENENEPPGLEPDEPPPEDVPEEPGPPNDLPVPEDGDEVPPDDVPDEALPEPELDLPEPPGLDADVDGVPDEADLCAGSPPRARVWLDGPWRGCAEGQRRDADQIRPELNDQDADGVDDTTDVCLGTRASALVWAVGPWRGCAGGQRANNRLPPLDTPDIADDDGDGIADDNDLCGGTRAGALIWQAGPWRGCAGGQRRD